MYLTRKFSLKTSSIIIIVFLLFIPAILSAQAVKGKEKIFRVPADIEAQVISWRRDFHEHPELGNSEFRTAGIIAGHLRSLGIEVQTGIAVTGVKGVLKGALPGPVVALRADMDALPITEQTEVPFASKVVTTYNGAETGVMHACGHDAHVAILMGVAEILAGMKDSLKGTVVFIFQPAEEGSPVGEEGGAELMIKEGVLHNPEVDVIFGLHTDALIETGKILYKPAAIMAGVSDFKITVKGKGSHGSTPWTSVDPVIVSSQIINSIQSIVSRNVNLVENPAVISIGSIHGGNRSNIIPDEVEMLGTIRTFSNSDEELIYSRLGTVCDKVAESAGAEAELTVPYSSHYPVNFNNEKLTETILPTLYGVAGKENVILINARTMAEDFAFYSQEIPGFFFFVGGMPPGSDAEKTAPHHTAGFFLDESSFKTGINAMVNLTLGYMEKGW